MSNKKICLIQPGRLGDIIFSLPIAKYYTDLGYLIDWYIHEDYYDISSDIDYVNFIKIPNQISIFSTVMYVYYQIRNDFYEKIIDLSIGFPSTKAVMDFNYKTFVHNKYAIAQVDISKRWQLEFKRNYEKS